MPTAWQPDCCWKKVAAAQDQVLRARALVHQTQESDRCLAFLLLPVALGDIRPINADSPGLRNIGQRLIVMAFAHRHLTGDNTGILMACADKQGRIRQPGMVETMLFKVGEQPLRCGVGERHSPVPVYFNDGIGVENRERCQSRHFLLGPLALGNILSDCRDTDDLPRGVPHWGQAAERPEPAVHPS